MNLEKYKYNGFKLYERKYPPINRYITTYKKLPQEPDTSRLLVQYKDGVPFKYWIEYIEDEWEQQSIELESRDVFITNMSEEEVFGILL